MPTPSPILLAAVDLGSNSFHLQVGRVEGEQIFYLDSHKESVRLAGGLGADSALDDTAQQRALSCLARMGERLRGMPTENVRVVGTNTLRVAKNAEEFLTKAREALGFDIEVVAGREEARLIYLGVAHSLAYSDHPRLVIDIGGGSTELMLGSGYRATVCESVKMGCVVWSARFFPNCRVTKPAMKEAILAAEVLVAPLLSQYKRGRWESAIGSSGTARALAEILLQNGQSGGDITRDGLKWLRSQVIAAGDAEKLAVPGLKPDRRPVLAGGLAVMSGLFETLRIDTMAVAQGAMREGILWDLLGRHHSEDMREVTVGQFLRRYQVDIKQASRVESSAMALLRDLGGDTEEMRRVLSWAARLHEIGLSVAHSGQHRHAAYILENADMPGFSRQDQTLLAKVVRSSRGRLDKLGLPSDDLAWRLILPLRLAVVLHQNRAGSGGHLIRLRIRSDGARVLRLISDRVQGSPWTLAALEAEARQWTQVGIHPLILDQDGG